MPDFDNTMKWYFFSKDVDKVPWLIIFFLLFIIFKYPTQIQLFVSAIQRLFASCSVKISKKSIENEINARVLNASKKVYKELDEVLPYSIKIQWVKESNRQAFLDDKRVIVCMDHNRTRNQNIVYALNDYVEHGLMPVIKKHVDKDIMKSSKLVLVKKLITISYKRGLNYFLENIFYEEVEADENIKHIVNELIRLDDSGMFVQILLREYIDKGKKYCTGVVNPDFTKETKEILNFLYEIANRDKRDMSQLDFLGKYFKVGIILVADDIVYDLYGLNAYTRRFREKLRLGIDNIYICSRGNIKVNIALRISDKIKKDFPDLDEPKVFHYDGRDKYCKEFKGVCIAYNNINDTILTKYKSQSLAG